MANKENIRKWVEALRSGKYQQMKGKLSDGKCFCCLGVACEVAIENGVKMNKIVDNSGTEIEYQGQLDSSAGELPEDVSRWLDLVVDDEDGFLRFSSDPKLPTPEHRNFSATTWNDSMEYTFAQIADLIEATYLREGAQ